MKVEFAAFKKMHEEIEEEITANLKKYIEKIGLYKVQK